MSILRLLCVLLCGVYVCAQADTDLEVSRLHKFLENPRELDVIGAIESAKNMSSVQLNTPIFGNRPLMHHVLNLYMINKDSTESKKLLLLLADVLLQGGISPNSRYGKDPDLMTKTLMIRELNLASRLVEEGACLTMPIQLQMLFTMACNPTPVAKMLLHADTILRGAGVEHSIDPEELLASASLPHSSMPPLRSVHLAKLSGRYREMLSQLGRETDGSTIPKVPLGDILGSVDEITSGFFRQLVMNHATASSSLSTTLTQLSSTLAAIIDHSGRNLMHLVALSGSTGVVRDLQVLFDGAPVDSMKELAHSLNRRDTRSLTPLQTAAVRFGDSAHFNSLLNLALQCGALPQNTSAESFSFYLKSHKGISKTRTDEQLGATDNGGWNGDRLDKALAGDGRCNILEVYELPEDPIDFFEKYVATGTPVVFRAAAKNQPQITKLLRNFEKSHFLEHHGRDFVGVAPIPYSNTFGIPGRVVDMLQASDIAVGGSIVSAPGDSTVEPQKATSTSIPDYVFTTAVSDSLKAEAPTPNFLGALAKDVELQFYLGVAGTGAPPHFHGHAVNSLAFGEKVSLAICHAYIYFPLTFSMNL